MLTSPACAGRIDRFVVDRVVVTGATVGDTGKACMMGAALLHPLDSVSKRSPALALTVAEGVAAVCDEAAAWEADLAVERARRNFVALGDARAAEITDAGLHAARAHGRAAARFERSFQSLQEAFGTVGEGCPSIAERDEFTYVFGLVGGTLALLNDRASGGVNDIPLDRLAAIARGSTCVDDARWWSVPSALRGAAWAVVPGSGPADQDPWQLLEEAATRGEASGVRVARAIQVLIASNQGNDEVVTSALAAHAASLAANPADPAWLLLDQYATEVSLHQSDLRWTRERGHRTERFGTVPTDVAAPAPTGPDPFGEVFGADPFENKEETP
ncbi:MAG: hypothetical protein ABMA64_35505 [Myxococcota bacterium]